MNPEQVPPFSPPASPSKNNSRQKVALWLLIGPSALFVGVIILYAVTNLIFPEVAIIKTFTNIAAFLAGLISFLTWLPGMIIGIVLLATKGKDANN